MNAITNVQDLMKAASGRYFAEARGRWIFRGHSKASYELIPSVGRAKHTSKSRERYAHAKLVAEQIEEAEQLLQKSLEINPRHSPTLVDLGTAYARMGDEAVAEGYFKDAIDADSNNAFAYAAYARFLMRTRRYTEGLEMAVAALETNPRDVKNRQLVEEIRNRLQSGGWSGDSSAGNQA